LLGIAWESPGAASSIRFLLQDAVNLGPIINRSFATSEVQAVLDAGLLPGPMFNLTVAADPWRKVLHQ
jgi:hypothetical protein